MLKILVKKQLTEIFRSYFYNPKNNKSRSKAAVAGYIALFVVLMAGVLGGMFTMLALGLCGPLAAVGMDWLYFALMGLLAVLLGAFGSVFNTYSGLYLAKDNDLLLSMPIPVDTLMASRLLSVYLMGLMYSAVVIVPTVIVYWAVAPVTAGAVLGGVLLVLLISVFVLTLACALGWVVAKISLRLKHKSFVTVLVSLVFFGGYYFFYFKAQTLIEDLLANAAVYGERIRGAAYPLYLFGRVGAGDGVAMANQPRERGALMGFFVGNLDVRRQRCGATQHRIGIDDAPSAPLRGLVKKEYVDAADVPALLHQLLKSPVIPNAERLELAAGRLVALHLVDVVPAIIKGVNLPIGKEVERDGQVFELTKQAANRTLIQINLMQDFASADIANQSAVAAHRITDCRMIDHLRGNAVDVPARARHELDAEARGQVHHVFIARANRLI